MRYLSVCSGIEAATVAWHPLGWEPVAFSEIEPFPSAVLRHRWPHVPNLGDMTKYADWPEPCTCAVCAATGTTEINLGGITLRIYVCRKCGGIAIDLLAGGTPCQGFSVAGLRGGLDDPRSQLMFAYVEIAARYRPRWLVWENVPGVLSSNGGADFAAFLGALTGREVRVPEDGWRNSGTLQGIEAAYGVAWRTLDAQYFGVAQRRRRVFVVGHLGDWRRAAAVLFERHCLQGHPAPSRETGKRIAGTLSARTEGGGGLGTDFDLAGGVIEATRTRTPQGGSFDSSMTGGVVAAVTSKWAKGSGGPAGDECQNLIPTLQGGFFDEAGPTHALRAEGFDASEDGTGRGTPLVPVGTFQNTGQGWWNDEPIAQTLRDASLGGASHANVVAFSSKDAGAGELSPTLRSMGHDGSHANGGGQVAVAFDPTAGSDMRAYSEGTTPGLKVGSGIGIPWAPGVATAAVRRLTPKECARLQGFPDTYLDITFRGKPAADGPKYKALGNSMAVPCMRWIGERIELVESLTASAPETPRAQP